jgi:hypothetical protein
MLRHHLANLARNLGAGLRLVLMLPVSRLRFRVDLVQLLLLLVVSALIDLGIDWVRFGADGYFTWFGLGNEIFGAGVLLLSAAILAIAFGQREFVLALPVLVLAGFPLLQVVRIAPSVILLPNPGFSSGRVRRVDDRLGVRAVGALRRISRSRRRQPALAARCWADSS